MCDNLSSNKWALLVVKLLLLVRVRIDVLQIVHFLQQSKPLLRADRIAGSASPSAPIRTDPTTDFGQYIGR